MKNHHFIAGKIHYKWPFSIAILTYPEGNLAVQRIFSPSHLARLELAKGGEALMRRLADVPNDMLHQSPPNGGFEKPGSFRETVIEIVSESFMLDIFCLVI